MSIITTFFDISRWRTSVILDCSKFEMLSAAPVRKANMRNHAKFRGDRLNSCRDFAIVGFFRMDFLNFKIVTVHTVKSVEQHHRAKFRRTH